MKIPPNNIDAEQSLIVACMLAGRNEISEIIEVISETDFYKSSHNKIFKTIKNLYNKKLPTDIENVVIGLKELNLLEEIGGASYLSHMMDFVPVAVNMEYQAKVIKSFSTGRKILDSAHKISQELYDTKIDPENIVTLLDKAQSAILNINYNIDSNAISVADLCVKRISQYEDLCAGREPGVKTGFRSIDMLTGGFWGSLFIIIAARPGIGKTAFMLNMAKNMASSGHKVGIFSIEMDKESLLDRMISSLSGINSIRLRTGRIGSSDWKAINEAAEKIYSLPIVIDDTGGLTVQEIKRRTRLMVKKGVEIIFIDQLSKIRGGIGQSDWEKRSCVVNELAEFKKELRMPIVLLAQINRKAEDTKKPGLNHLKSTGSLEEDSDICLIGHRDYPYTMKPEDETKSNWELAKNRNGATMNIPMQWDGKTTTFFEITKTYQEHQI